MKKTRSIVIALVLVFLTDSTLLSMRRIPKMLSTGKIYGLQNIEDLQVNGLALCRELHAYNLFLSFQWMISSAIQYEVDLQNRISEQSGSDRFVLYDERQVEFDFKNKVMGLVENVPLHTSDMYGRTLLIFLAENNDALVMERLLERERLKGWQTQVNKRDNKGRTALFVAAQLGFLELIKILDRYGAELVDASGLEGEQNSTWYWLNFHSIDYFDPAPSGWELDYWINDERGGFVGFDPYVENYVLEKYTQKNLLEREFIAFGKRSEEDQKIIERIIGYLKRNYIRAL